MCYYVHMDERKQSDSEGWIEEFVLQVEAIKKAELRDKMEEVVDELDEL